MAKFIFLTLFPVTAEWESRGSITGSGELSDCSSWAGDLTEYSSVIVSVEWTWFIFQCFFIPVKEWWRLNNYRSSCLFKLITAFFAASSRSLLWYIDNYVHVCPFGYLKWCAYLVCHLKEMTELPVNVNWRRIQYVPKILSGL